MKKGRDSCKPRLLAAHWCPASCTPASTASIAEEQVSIETVVLKLQAVKSPSCCSGADLCLASCTQTLELLSALRVGTQAGRGQKGREGTGGQEGDRRAGRGQEGRKEVIGLGITAAHRLQAF